MTHGNTRATLYRLAAVTIGCLGLISSVPAFAQEQGGSTIDGIELAPLVPEPDPELAPLVQEPDPDLAPLVPEPDPDLGPLAPEPDPDLAPLVPEPDPELAPLVRPDIHPGQKQLSEEELIERGAATLRDPDAARKSIARSIEWAGREFNAAMKKGKVSDEDMRNAIKAVEEMSRLDKAGASGAGTGSRQPAGKPIPLEINVAEQLEWQRRAEASNGTMTLVEKPLPVTTCRGGNCTTKMVMHYELRPVAPLE